jgi:hypothetical protein
MPYRKKLHPAFRVDNDVHIARAKALTHHFLKSETHVCVGDHEPEMRNDLRAELRANAWKLDMPPEVARQ